MPVLCGFFHYRLLQLILRATGKTFAMIHDRDPRTDLLDLFHIMRSIKDRGALPVQFLDPLQYLVAALRIDGNGRLIQDDQPRPVRNSTGNIKPPQQSAGKLVGTEMFEPLKPGKCDRILYELFALLFGRYIESAEIVDILVHIHLCKYGNILRDNADLPLDVVAVGTHLLPHDFQRTAAIAQKFQYAVHGCCLTGTIWTEKPKDLPFLYGETEMVKREKIIIILDQILNMNYHDKRIPFCKQIFWKGYRKCYQYSQYRQPGGKSKYKNRLMKKILYNRQKNHPPVPHMKMQDLCGISYEK